MKVKHLVIAVAVLGGASLATWLLKPDNTVASLDEREGQVLVTRDVIEKVAAIHLHTPTGDVDLATAVPGGKWTVRNYHELPADFTKIKSLTDGLEQAKVTRFASAQAARIAQMGFDGSTLELRDADGKALRTLHLGRNVESGGRFLKFDDETKAYVASFATYLDATAKNWANTALLPAKPEEITALEVSFPEGGTLQLHRENGTAPWTATGLAEGEKLKESEINSLVTKLTGLRFTETADPTAADVQEARSHARTFKVTLATGKSYEVALGRKPAPPAPPPTATTPPPETPTGENASTPEPDAATPPAPPPPPPPGPVYVFIQCSDTSDPINDLMQRRGFQIYEYTFTSLPANRTALIEQAPPAAPAPTPAAPAPTPATPPVSDSVPSPATPPPANP